jgi:OOP family OmpA-OmpF porin
MRIDGIVMLAALAVPPALAEEGRFYGGAGVGMAKLGGEGLEEFMANVNMGPPTNVNDTDTGFKLYAGYRFTPQFSAEAGYSSLGKFSFDTGTPSTGEVTASSIDIAALAVFPVAGRFKLFGRFGVGIWDLKVKVNSSPGFAGERRNKTSVSPLIGAGATYSLTSRVALRADLERHFAVGTKENTGQFDFDLVTVGVEVDF